MKLKVDWRTWHHAYKKREIEKTFIGCPVGCFERGLELGAGDGFQSVFLADYIVGLVSTEINGRILSQKNSGSIEYKVCSAEEAVGKSGDNSFDIVFSSNLLEHITDPVSLLRGIRRIVKDDGITVHIVPSRLWKLCHMLFHVPANTMAMIEHIWLRRGAENRLRETLFLLRQLADGFITGANTLTDRADKEDRRFGNNPGNRRKRPAFLKRLFVPLPHGRAERNRDEFKEFSKHRWMKAFDDAGFDLIAVRKGPAASGYGLGWTWADRIAEKAGLASELIYIAQKKGHRSPFSRFFS